MASDLIERLLVIGATVVLTLMVACAAGVPVSQARSAADQTTDATQTTVQAAPDSTVHIGNRLPAADPVASP